MDLFAFFRSADGSESEALLSRLIEEQALSVVSRIAGYKVRAPNTEDVRNDVLADLISRLRM